MTTNVDDIVTNAIEQARAAQCEALINAVRGATLVAETLTTQAEFRVEPPVDLPDDKPRRLFRIEVTATRTLGVEPVGDGAIGGEPPCVTVRGLVQDLKSDGTPYANRTKTWTYLPDQLAAHLLGLAHVA